MEWSGESDDGAVLEAGFQAERDGRLIPGRWWAPSGASGPRPLVLMGHGGSGHKRNERMEMLGRLFAGTHGWCAASIDGPVHGDRGPVTDPTQPEYSEMWRRGDAVQGMIADWQAVLCALEGLDEVDATRIGYWGLSMGTLFGLPFVASEPRVKVAVLGKAGMTGTSAERARIGPEFERFAPQLRTPVLFTIQWDDERFERAGQLDLYDRLGSPDKRLHAYPGIHVDNGPDAFETQAAFLERYL